MEEEKLLAVGVTPQTAIPADTEKSDRTESVIPTKTLQPAPEQGAPKQVSINPDIPVKEPEKSAKPKRRSPKKKQSGMDMKQVDALIVGISDYVAARPNMAHWKMSEKEVQTITQPLGNIIAKSDYMEKIAENSDEIALVLAVGAVFIPRAVISFSMMKQNKKDKEKKKHVQLRSEEKQDKVSDGNSTEINGNSTDVPSTGRDLSFLGNGIALY